MLGVGVLNIDHNITAIGGFVGASLWKGLASRVGLAVDLTFGAYGVGYFPTGASNAYATEASTISAGVSVPIRTFWRVYLAPTGAISQMWFSKNVAEVSTKQSGGTTMTTELVLNDESMLLLGVEAALLLGQRNNIKLVGRIYAPPIAHESMDGPFVTGSISYGFFP